MQKYKYNICNLDCANCAREIEESLNKNKNFKNVSVNFGTSTISYLSDKEFNIKELNKLISKIEPSARIEDNNVEIKKDYHLVILIIALIIGLLGYFLVKSSLIKMILYIISYSLLLYKTFINAIKLLVKSKTINENLLITVSCIGALIIGEELEGMMVITLYTIGKILEEKAINTSRNSIKNLLDIKQSYANKKINDELISVMVEELKIDDCIIVRKGERVPTDGIITSGITKLDTSALTGESEPLEVEKNSKVLSGSINMGDVIEVKVTNLFKDSTVAKILALLEDATDKKAKTETVISKFSKIYTPVIILLAIVIVVILPILFKVDINDSIYRGLTFLVISCPCAIAISIPLSYFTGIGVASKNGILIKGSNYLDNLSMARNIIFDKTGTLTNGSFEVTKIEIFNSKYSYDKIVNILTKGESFSNHPIAKSIVKLAKNKINNKDIINYKEIDGEGITFKYHDHEVSIGNQVLCDCQETALLHLNIDGKHVASISINDGLKNNAEKSIGELKQLGMKTYMFTGDKKEVALNIGNKLKIDSIKYEMLPNDKYQAYEDVSGDNISIFVGDGINDAPVLKRADIGISMGGVGTSSAIEASDIVLMTDDLTKIPLAINLSKYTKFIIKENLIFAILVKLVILLLSVLGLANMWLAVFADTGVTLLTILNTLRIIKKFNNI